MSSASSSGIGALSRRGSSYFSDGDLNTEIFGVTLMKAMSLDEGRTLLASQEIPTLLDLILCNLEFKVIDAEVFVNANPDSEEVNKLRDSLNRGHLPASINGEPDVLSGLLRRYLRELPEPLVPVTHFKSLLSILTSSKKFKNGKDKGGVEAARQIVEGSDFNRVHHHALRRICALLRTMLTSWWSDSGEANKILEIMAVNIMRPDNLNRAFSSHKEVSSVREAVNNLITHSASIFVQKASDGADSAARRISMIRRGERASRLQLMDEEGSTNSLTVNGPSTGGDSSSRRRLSSFSHSDTPRIDFELRNEFKAFKEATNIQISSLLETISHLKEEIDALKRDKLKRDGSDIYASANGSDVEETPPVSPSSQNKGDPPQKMLVSVVSIDSPKKKSSNRSLADSTEREPSKKSSTRSLADSTEKIPSKKSSNRSLDGSKHDSKKTPKSDFQDEDTGKDDAHASSKKHKSKKKAD